MEHQGSLNGPPITLVRRRGLIWRQLGLALLFVTVCAWLTHLGWQEHLNPAGKGDDDQFELLVIAPAGLFLFGWVSIMAAASLVRPPLLEITPEGITHIRPFGRSEWRWSEVTNFRPYRRPLAGALSGLAEWTTAPAAIVFDYTPARHVSLTDRINRLVGVQGTLAGGWPGSPTELCELLSQAQTRWYGARATAAQSQSSKIILGAEIEFTQSRFVPGIVLALFSVIVGFSSYPMWTDPEMHGVLGWIIAGPFAVILSVMLCRVLWPDRVLVDAEGITAIQLGMRRHWGWTYGGFELRRYRHGQRMIAFRPMRPGAWPAFVAFMARNTGLGALPGLWTVSTDKVIDTLNAAVDHHLGRSLPAQS